MLNGLLFFNSSPFSSTIRYFLPQRFIFTCAPWTTCQTLQIILNNFLVVCPYTILTLLLEINFFSEMSFVVHSPLLFISMKTKKETIIEPNHDLSFIRCIKKNIAQRTFLLESIEYLYLFVFFSLQNLCMTQNTPIWTIPNGFNKCHNSVSHLNLRHSKLHFF